MIASRPVLGGVVRTLRDGLIQVSRTTANNAFVLVRRNGAIEFSGDGGTSTHIVFNPHPWHRSRMTTIGDGFWVRFTRTAGTGLYYTGATVGVWWQLNTDVSCGYEVPFGAGSVSGNYTIEIATSSGGSPIVAASSAGGYQLVVDSTG